MNRDRDRRRLLSDILAEESDAGFRDALFGQTLRAVRRQRRFRAVRRAGSVAVFLMLSALLAFHFFKPRTSLVTLLQRGTGNDYALVHTQPLSQAMIVTTQPFISSRQVASTPPVHIITTSDSRPSVVELTDDQLLELAKGAPVALVRHGPHQAELIFANESDREKLFHN